MYKFWLFCGASSKILLSLYLAVLDYKFLPALYLIPLRLVSISLFLLALFRLLISNIFFIISMLSLFLPFATPNLLNYASSFPYTAFPSALINSATWFYSYCSRCFFRTTKVCMCVRCNWSNIRLLFFSRSSWMLSLFGEIRALEWGALLIVYQKYNQCDFISDWVKLFKAGPNLTTYDNCSIMSFQMLSVS